MTQKLIILISLTAMAQAFTIFDFNKNADITNWNIVDDVVMGGRSSGKFYLNEEGNGVFKGNVSLENNGGFSSLRYRFDAVSTGSYSKITLKVKGDGKSYQFRVKDKSSNYYSYITYFNSSTGWKTIEINLSDMYPAFRGRKLSSPNFNSERIEEIAILIGNKKEETFKLEIDSIVLE